MPRTSRSADEAQARTPDVTAHLQVTPREGYPGGAGTPWAGGLCRGRHPLTDGRGPL